MRLTKLTMIVTVAALLATGACDRLTRHSKSAVERAINDHLAENRSLKSGTFQTRIERVDFKGDTADALVRFESRQSSALFVEVRYGLRLENGRWQVVSSAPMSGQGGDSHGASQDQSLGPPGTQPTGSAQPGPQPSH